MSDVTDSRLIAKSLAMQLSDWSFDEAVDRIAAALSDARRIALIKAVKATCWRCREAPGLFVKYPDGTRHHRYDDRVSHPCVANAIHDLLAAEPGEKS